VTARTLILFGLLIALAMSACGSSSRERVAPPPAPRPPALYTVGESLLGVPGQAQVRLASAPVTPLAGWLTPAAVPSPDGRYVAYNAWRELREDDPSLSWADQGIDTGDPLARPSIRLHDLAAGTDEVLVEGAFSVAWRGDGAIAYFRANGEDYRAGIPYRGEIVVRDSLDSPDRVWTTHPGRYIVVGWAGSTLVAYEEHEGETLDVLALDAPGEVRLLAADSGLVAVSPDGEEVFVEQGPDGGPPTVRVLAVASGAERAALDLTGVDPAVGVVGYAGDWQGDVAVASSSSGVAVFRIQGRRVTLEQALRWGGEDGIFEPRLALEGHVTGWTTSAQGGAFVDCDRASGRCADIVPLPRARGIRGFPTWRRPAYNPSRPQEGGK
jgi:hypothetical protein